jgi:hypothetical protein
MLKELSLYKVEPAQRSSLFYDQYRWCITINISEASCLRYLDADKFERAIINAKYWAENDRWTDRIWTRTKETALRETRDVLLEETTPFKTVVSFNTVSIYTNRRKLADRLIDLGNDGVILRLVREAVISKPAGCDSTAGITICLQNLFSRTQVHSRPKRHAKKLLRFTPRYPACEPGIE